MHAAVFGLLQSLGYACEWTETQTVGVGEKRPQEPTTLAADVQRIVAELGAARPAGGEPEQEVGDGQDERGVLPED